MKQRHNAYVQPLLCGKRFLVIYRDSTGDKMCQFRSLSAAVDYAEALNETEIKDNSTL